MHRSFGISIDGLLQTFPGGSYTAIDGAVKHQRVHSIRKIVTPAPIPVPSAVNGFCIGFSNVGYGLSPDQPGFFSGFEGTRGYSIVRFSTRVIGVIAPPTFEAESYLQSIVKVFAHELTSRRA
jgi:hypothetical protein